LKTEEVIKVIDNISKSIKGQSCHSFLKKIVVLKTSAEPKTIGYSQVSVRSRAKSNLFFSKLVLIFGDGGGESKPYFQQIGFYVYLTI